MSKLIEALDALETITSQPKETLPSLVEALEEELDEENPEPVQLEAILTRLRSLFPGQFPGVVKAFRDSLAWNGLAAEVLLAL